MRVRTSDSAQSSSTSAESSASSPTTDDLPPSRGPVGLSVEEVHQRLFASGFDLDCDRGHYTLEQHCAQICARLDVVRSQHELAEFWAEAFVPNADVLALVGHVRCRAFTGILTNNRPLVHLMLEELFRRCRGFNVLCFSYEVMSTKPEPRAFLATLGAT